MSHLIARVSAVKEDRHYDRAFEHEEKHIEGQRKHRQSLELHEEMVCCYYVCFGLRKYKKCQK